MVERPWALIRDTTVYVHACTMYMCGHMVVPELVLGIVPPRVVEDKP